MLSKEFVTAGRAIFTACNPEGVRYTYKVKKVEDDDNRRPTVYFLQLLTGPDNTADYTYIGMINPLTLTVRLTAASKLPEDSLPVKVARWVLSKVYRGETLPDGYSLQHAGRCGRCGRLLTVPSSIETGLGPDCAAAMAF